MVATMALTAMWLEGRLPTTKLRAWELLRLTALAMGLALGWAQGYPDPVLAVAAAYGVLNLICLLVMPDRWPAGAPRKAVPGQEASLQDPVRLNLLR
jgi:apolipoprotein N-acyltransferase